MPSDQPAIEPDLMRSIATFSAVVLALEAKTPVGLRDKLFAAFAGGIVGTAIESANDPQRMHASIVTIADIALQKGLAGT